MGYKSPIHRLDLPEFTAQEPGEEDLVVKVVAPSAKESGDLNAGRRTIVEDDTEREETSGEYMRRAMAYLAPKIRFWNLEYADDVPVPLPRDVGTEWPVGSEKRIDAQVDHLMEQDENIVLAIYHAWRLAGMPAKEDTGEGKESETPSTPGPGASPANDRPWDLRELEMQIPMG